MSKKAGSNENEKIIRTKQMCYISKSLKCTKRNLEGNLQTKGLMLGEKEKKG